MKRILMTLIKKTGGINLSGQIPFSYIIGLSWEKFIERVYAIIRLRRFKSAYVSPSAILRAPSKLQYKKGLIIAKGCYIDALGQGGIQCGERVHFGLKTTMIVSGSLQNIGKGIKMGDNVGLGTHGFYGGAGGLEIGNDCIFGNYVSIHPENHNYRALNIPIRLQV